MGRTACTEPQCLYKGALYLDSYVTLRPEVDSSKLVTSLGNFKQLFFSYLSFLLIHLNSERARISALL